ncbi:unnamed protein product, partial [Onchocerca flexuosa]|uniref:Uncharacterized protein n=1 Tax=Onchocerca flexuosa TaxID=387005 RepID=A0A183HAF7_9BILA
MKSQYSAGSTNMALRRRSRRLASQEREDFFTSSSIDVLGVGNDEQVFTKIESNDESKRIEEINIEKKLLKYVQKSFLMFSFIFCKYRKIQVIKIRQLLYEHDRDRVAQVWSQTMQ